MKQKLTVIIPFLNEEKTIEQILKQVLKQKMVGNIILVDDGSTDNSVKVLKKHLDKRVTLIKHKQNKGRGAAIISGLKKAPDGLVIIQDADLEYDPNQYLKLLDPLKSKRADFVMGNRWGSKKRGYLLAQIGNAYLVKLTNFLFDTDWNDTYTCYKVGSKKIWLDLELKSNGFEIEAEITGKLALKEVNVLEVPIEYSPRRYSEGKKINVRDVFKGTKTLFKIRFERF